MKPSAPATMHDEPALARVKPLSLARVAIWTLALTAVAGAAHLLDPVAYPAWVSRSAEGKDWNRLLRVLGFVPTWLLVAGALLLAHRARDWTVRGGPQAGLIAAGAALGGLVAEIGKLLLRRQRPDDSGGAYVFVPFDQNTWDTGDLGLPSSHAGVAFGAAFAVMMLWPRAGWLVVITAVGCGLTRVMSGRHFVSDVIGGAPAGFLGAAGASWVVGFIAGRLNRGRAARGEAA